MDKKQIVTHLEDTIDVCEFLIEKLEYLDGLEKADTISPLCILFSNSSQNTSYSKIEANPIKASLNPLLLLLVKSNTFPFISDFTVEYF